MTKNIDRRILASLIVKNKTLSNYEVATLNGITPCISGARRLRELRALFYDFHFFFRTAYIYSKHTYFFTHKFRTFCKQYLKGKLD